jgi:hypothetical protein
LETLENAEKQGEHVLRTAPDTANSSAALVPAKPTGLTQRQENFARLFVETGVAVDAYLGAYRAERTSRASARVEAWRLLRKPAVAARVQELQDAVADRSTRSTAALIRDLEEMVDADPNELARIAVSCCRHCHGQGGGYQWRDAQELAQAMERYLATAGTPKPEPAPDASGGYGFDLGNEPNPDCLHCGGAGIPRVVFNSSTDVSLGARRLLRGIELFPDGSLKRVLLHDQAALRIELHKLRGLHIERSESRSLTVSATVAANVDVSAEAILEAFHRGRGGDHG